MNKIMMYFDFSPHFLFKARIAALWRKAKLAAKAPFRGLGVN
jgi:hypothetical protein